MARRAETILGIANQVLVQVAIVNGEIRCFPKRSGEVLIFNAWDPARSCPSRPREVRWVVHGLQPGQFLRIEPKDGSAQMFGLPVALDIPYGFNSISSGVPQLRVGGTGSLKWDYNLVLFEQNGAAPRELARLDPGIVIKDDP